jgi:hypothetical protein
VTRLRWSVLASVVSTALLACAGAKPPPLLLDVASGQAFSLTPRADAKISFTGQYFSSQSGTLTLSQGGRALCGSYEQQDAGCDVTGQLTGTVVGNLATLNWSERHTCKGSSWLVSGRGKLLFDAAQLGDGLVRLFGERETQLAPKAPSPRATLRDRFEEPEPWTATSVSASEPLLSRGSGQRQPRWSLSVTQMAERFVIARHAVELTEAESLQDELLTTRLSEAKAEAEQARVAFGQWQRGDQRYFLQIEYCYGQSLLRVEDRLLALHAPVPAGLSGVVPGDPPFAWVSASCLPVANPR